jgi:glycosyltransferase involved in cell wall biosynthesis
MTEIDDSLTIIVPTIGRNSLKHTLESISIQAETNVQILIVADGIYPKSRQLVESKGPPYTYHELSDGPHHDWGARARNFALALAKTAYIAFMDDDDRYLPGAFQFIKAAIKVFPGHPFLFRMMHEKSIIWKTHELAVGNISSQMVVVPNDQRKLSRFTERYEGDYDFIKGTADLYSPGYDPFIWREEITAILFKANGK